MHATEHVNCLFGVSVCVSVETSGIIIHGDGLIFGQFAVTYCQNETFHTAIAVRITYN